MVIALESDEDGLDLEDAFLDAMEAMKIFQEDG